MKRLVLLTLAALILQGCRVDRKDPRYTQAPPPPVTEDLSATPKDQKSDYFGLNLNSIFEKSKGVSQESRIREVVEPLAAILLNQTNLSNSEFKGHSQTTWALNFMNTQIVEALKESPGDARLKALLANYRNRLLQDCHARDLKACRNLTFFQRDPQVVSLIKVMALQTTDVEAYFRMLAIAFELKSAQPDPELKQMVYARMTEFIKIYVSVGTSGEMTTLQLKRLSDTQKREFVFYSTFITSVLRTSPEVKLTGAQSVELYNWLSSNQMESVLGRDLAFVISELVANQLEQPEIWTKFVANFNRDQRDEELSYSNALKRVKEFDPELLTRLGVTPYDLQAKIQSRSTDLAAMFFLSRLFDLRQPLRERYLWNIAKLEPIKAMEMIEAFVRVTMIDRTLDTHKKMADFYRRYQRDGGAKSEMLYETMKFADVNLSPKWKDYVTRIQQIELFFAEEIERRHSNEKSGELSERILKMRNFFEQLNPSIKYMATYPNMIMFAYFAAKANLNFYVTTFFGSKIEITKELVMHDLMEGKLAPMFLFTSFRSNESRRNSEGIDSVQVLWALYFAMAMDLPRLYDISADEFLGTFISTYKTRTDNHMRRLITYHEKLLAPNSEINQLLSICSAPQNAQNVFVNQFDMDRLKYLTFLGEFGQYSRPPLKSAIDAHNPSKQFLPNSLDEAIEVLRSDVDPKLRRLFLIKSAYKLARSTDQAALAQIDSLMAESLGMRTRLLESSRLLIEQLPACMIQMRDIEQRRRRELLNMEIAYMTKVQSALSVMQSSANEQAAVVALKADPFFAELDTTKPLIQSLNDLLAAKSGMENAFNSIAEYRSNYQLYGGFQKESSGRIYFHHRGSDLMVRLATFAMYGFNGTQIGDRIDRLKIVLPASMKELEIKTRGTFSRAEAVQLFASPSDRVLRTALAHFRAHIQWPADIHGATPIFRSFIRESTALYKFNFLGDLDLENEINCVGPCEARKIQDARAGAETLILQSRSFLEKLRFNEPDRALLRLFDAPSFYNFDNSTSWSSGPRYLFVNDNIQQDLNGMTDEAFIYLTSMSLGNEPKFRGLRPGAESEWVQKSDDNAKFFREDAIIKADELMRRTNYFDRSQSYYLSLRDKQDLLIFPIPQDIDRQITLFHSLLIMSDLRLSELFVESVSQWSRSNPLPVVQFTTLIDGRVISPITSSMVGSYRAQIDQFHELTSGVFKQGQN